MKNETKEEEIEITEERLEALGLTQASKNLKQLKEFNRKCLIAYENYRYVKMEKITQFNVDLQKKTEKRDKHGNRTYDQLVFTLLEHYTKVPPAHALDALAIAKERSCFDYFEIGKIEQMFIPKPMPDPIIFGRIRGCNDYFFIAQWDSDIKIDDLIKNHEG